MWISLYTLLPPPDIYAICPPTGSAGQRLRQHNPVRLGGAGRGSGNTPWTYSTKPSQLLILAWRNAWNDSNDLMKLKQYGNSLAPLKGTLSYEAAFLHCQR